jgi:glutathione synthase/RimK-type ligase-like ATP-grasp enzyme
MDFAFVVDPLPSLKAYKDSSVAMMRSARERGHTLFAIEQSAMYWDNGRTSARGVPLEVMDDDHDWYAAGEPQVRRLRAQRRRSPTRRARWCDRRPLLLSATSDRKPWRRYPR